MADPLRFYLMLSLVAQLALSQPCCTMLILWPSLACAGGSDCVLPMGDTGTEPEVDSCSSSPPTCGSARPCSTAPTCGDPEPNPVSDRPCDAPDGTPCDDDDCDSCPPTVPQKVPGEKQVTLNLPLAVAALYTIDLPRPARSLVADAQEPHPPPSNLERRARLSVWLN